MRKTLPSLWEYIVIPQCSHPDPVLTPESLTGASGGPGLTAATGGYEEDQRGVCFQSGLRQSGYRVREKLETICFGWIGEADETKPHDYIVSGPTVLVEFDNNGGPGNSANQILAIWREKGNEFGEDLLRNHYEAEHGNRSLSQYAGSAGGQKGMVH